MGRMYTVEFENVSVSAAQDLFEIAPATNKPIEIHAIMIAQTSDVADAEEEILRFKIIRGATTTGSGGSTPTAQPRDAIDTAAGFTAKANNTTAATGGTPVDLHVDAFNIRTGLQLVFTPEMRPKCSAAENRIVLNLPSAPSDALSMSGTIYVEEV